MIFKYTGKIKIDDEIELLNPKMRFSKIYYDMITNKFDLVAEFWEVDGGYKFARKFHFVNDTTGQLSMKMVMEKIANNDILNKFTPIS